MSSDDSCVHWLLRETTNFTEDDILAINITSLEEDFLYQDFTQVSSVRNLLVFLYVVVMILAIGGNALVCVTVAKNRQMHTTVHYYIVNLSVCDLLVGIFVLPIKLLELTAPAHWNILSDKLCTALMYLQTVVVFSSVLTLLATCIERYFAIVYPLQSHVRYSKSRVRLILTLVWLIPGMVASPFLYPAKAITNCLQSDYGVIYRLTCFDNFSEDFRRGYYIFLFVFIFLLPLVFITGTCIHISHALLRRISLQRQESLRRQENNRRKLAKMVMIVVVAFVVAWTPYFVVSLVTQLHTSNFLEEGHFFFTMLCINLFAFLNSCVNPFIYAVMSKRFRRGFTNIGRRLTCRKDSTASRASHELNGTGPRRRGAPSFSDASDSVSGQFTVLGLDSLRAFTRYSRRTLMDAWRNSSARFGSFTKSRSRSKKQNSMPNVTSVIANSNQVAATEDDKLPTCVISPIEKLLPVKQLNMSENVMSAVDKRKCSCHRSLLEPNWHSIPNLLHLTDNSSDDQLRRSSSETVITLLDESTL